MAKNGDRKPSGNSGGMFVCPDKFVEEHGGRVGDIAVYGQDKSVRGQHRFGVPQEARRVSARRRANQSNHTTCKLARMNLAIRGIDANLGPRKADRFRADLHPDLKADFVPVRKDLATATRASAKTTLAKPNRRSVAETELHPPFNMSDWGGENLRQD